jgi:ribonuclease T2
MLKLVNFLLAICVTICLGMGNALAVERANIAGQFDYYVMSLSWSPEYCASSDNPDASQCGERRYSLVVHGLWPQYNNGGFPSACSAERAVPTAIVDSMLDIMPSKTLIQHEWDKHGTCSGLSVEKYFQLTRQIYNSISIPDKYKQPSEYIITSVPGLESDLVRLNPNLDGSKIAIDCQGRFLQEIRVCYDKNNRPRVCGRKVTDKCRAQVVLRPIRG